MLWRMDNKNNGVKKQQQLMKIIEKRQTHTFIPEDLSYFSINETI